MSIAIIVTYAHGFVNVFLLCTIRLRLFPISHLAATYLFSLRCYCMVCVSSPLRAGSSALCGMVSSSELLLHLPLLVEHGGVL